MSEGSRADRDAILAYEAQLLINAFGAQNIDGLISRMEIQLKQALCEPFLLQIYFPDYPEKPPMFSLPKKISRLLGPSIILHAMKDWNPQDPPHIVDIINELALKISELSSQAITPNEGEILTKLEVSIKQFFKDLMKLEMNLPVIYCETKEEYRKAWPTLQKDHVDDKELIIRLSETTEGIFISGKGVFINKARFQELHLRTAQQYYFVMATVLVHELVGHAFISENTDYGKLEELFKLRVLDQYISADQVIQHSASSFVQNLIRSTAKFVHEGWSEWTSWFFTTQFDDPELQAHLLPKHLRKTFPYRDLKSFQQFLEAYLTFIQTGSFEFETVIPGFDHAELLAILTSKNISFEAIQYDFRKIIRLLETLFQDFSDFTKENHDTIFKTTWSLVGLDGKYSMIFPFIRYGIGFLIFKQVQERYSTVCMPELLKLVLQLPVEMTPTALNEYYYGKFEHWHDCKLAVLLTIPVTPTMRIDVNKCREVVAHHLARPSELVD